MNIKSDEAHRLSIELAALTGESMTAAVTVAVRERLDRLRAAASHRTADERAAEILAIAGRMRERLDGRPLADHGDLLYDETGLPR